MLCEGKQTSISKYNSLDLKYLNSLYYLTKLCKLRCLKLYSDKFNYWDPYQVNSTNVYPKPFIYANIFILQIQIPLKCLYEPELIANLVFSQFTVFYQI